MNPVKSGMHIEQVIKYEDFVAGHGRLILFAKFKSTAIVNFTKVLCLASSLIHQTFPIHHSSMLDAYLLGFNSWRGISWTLFTILL